MRHIDILIDERMLSYRIGHAGFIFFLDGILEIRRHLPNIWTIQHSNGTGINIQTNIIVTAEIDRIQKVADGGKTEAGVRAIIERSRKIYAAERSGRNTYEEIYNDE